METFKKKLILYNEHFPSHLPVYFINLFLEIMFKN